MSQSQLYTGALAMVLAALAMWLMLPRGNRPGRILGAALGIASLVCFAGLARRWVAPGSNGLTARWQLLPSSRQCAPSRFAVRFIVPCGLRCPSCARPGIFMVQGAQFLAVATIVVYAGAILVTFLFVLMLAQPGGGAYYDRVSWEGMLAATTGAVIVGVLTMTVVRVFNPPREPNVLATIAEFDLIGDGPNLSAEQVRRANLWREQTSEDGRWTLELDLADDAPRLAPGTKRVSSLGLSSVCRRWWLRSAAERF